LHHQTSGRSHERHRYDTVAEDGKIKNPAKAHNWKANYHDVRALVKFIETFAGER